MIPFTCRRCRFLHHAQAGAKLECFLCGHAMQAPAAATPGETRLLPETTVIERCPAKHAARQPARVKMRCAECGVRLKVPQSRIGKKVQCPLCTTWFHAAVARGQVKV